MGSPPNANDAGVELMAEPESCLIAFKSTDPRLNVFQLAEEMKQKGRAAHHLP